MMGCVYEIENLVNGKVYIGSTSNFRKRKEAHIYDLKKETHGNTPLQRAWKKYGAKNFRFQVVEEVDEDNQFVKEQEHINRAISAKREIYNVNSIVNNPRSSLPQIKQCVDCKKDYDSYYSHQKRCSACSKIYAEVYDARVLAPRRKKIAQQIAEREEWEQMAYATQMDMCQYIDANDGYCMDDSISIFEHVNKLMMAEYQGPSPSEFENGEVRHLYDTEDEFLEAYEFALEHWVDDSYLFEDDKGDE